MARINLLPWREELYREKQREFIVTLMGGVIIAGLIVLMSHLHFQGMIENQNQRNAFLQNEIEVLNKRIGRIKELEKMKDNLLARMNVIQELQSSRPESVHLLDELVRTLPDGVYLKRFAQQTHKLTMDGVAQSNARVSDYMRNIDNSQWFTGPRLDVINTTEANRRRIANFTLRGSQKTTATKQAETGNAGTGKAGKSS